MFKKAVRRQVKLKLALTGPSGSGKTLSALLIAAGLGKKIAFVDTENRSASLYAGSQDFPVPEFDEATMSPPYLVSKYMKAIQQAVTEKYDVLVIDSITHAWAGEGGLLSKKEALDATGKGNSYTNWASITKEHEALKAAILNADIHLICTMRSKQDYVLVENDKGKQAPKKVGMAPIQREGMEYEFTTVLDMSMNHHAEASKDRTGMFDGKLFIPSIETGQQFLTWLNSGAEPELTPPAPQPPIKPAPASQNAPQNRPAQQTQASAPPRAANAPASAQAPQKPKWQSREGLTEKDGGISEARIKRLWAISHSSGWTDADVHAYLSDVVGVSSSSMIHWKDYDAVCGAMAGQTFQDAMSAAGINVAPREVAAPEPQEPDAPWLQESGGPIPMNQDWHPPEEEREPGQEG